MIFPRSFANHLAVALIALTGAVPLRAQLATNSPFLPPPTANTAAPTAGAPLEYGGFLDTPSGERLFRVRDPARKTSDWVKLNERNVTLDVVARQYDDSLKALIIEYQGRTLTLAEREAKIVSAGSAPQAPPPMVPNAMPAAVTQAVVVNPTPADEQRRLEAVATEVARRRALREQSAGPGAAAAAPAVMPAGNFQQNPQGSNPQDTPRGGNGGFRGQGNRQQR